MGLHGPNLKMGEPLSDDNEYGRNQVGSNPPGEPHISGGIRGPSGAKLGNWGGCGGETTPKNKIGPIEVAHALVKGSRNENDVFPGGFSGLRAQGSGKEL